MLEGNQTLSFDLNEGPNRMQIMGFFARCQFLPSDSFYMQTFEEMFVTGFIDSGLSIFGPNVRNPTLRYVAYKDAEEGDAVHEAIRKQEETIRREKVRKATFSAMDSW